MRSAALLALALAGPAWARPLGPDEARALDGALDRFLGALERGPASEIMAVLPPRVRDHMARQAGMERAELDRQLEAAVSDTMGQATISKVRTDRGALDATDATLADGAALTWTFVPTSFVITIGVSRSRYEQAILALRDGGSWYLLRVEEGAQQGLIRQVYPCLEGVVFPPSSVTPLE